MAVQSGTSGPMNMYPESKTFDYQKNLIKRFLLMLIVSLLLAGCGGSSGSGTSKDTSPSNNDIIPEDRKTDWSSVGVEGGIPNRSVICSTLNPGATAADINSAIQNCPDGQVVYLNAGTYNTTERINITKGITLRGAGMDATIIQAGDVSSIVFIRGGYTNDATATKINITSGYTKGSTQLLLADASSISAGNFLYVDELNDASIPVSNTGYGGTCTWCGMYGAGGTRVRLQIVKVTGKNGNTINISPPLFNTFSSTNLPRVVKAPAYVEYAGIEDLTLKNDISAPFTQRRKNIWFQGAANSWVKNVKVENCGKRCVDLDLDNYRNEIRDSYITNCLDQVNSDTCYGVLIYVGSSNLVENNIFNNTANGPLLNSASGNVIAYNYLYGVHRTTNMYTWFWSDTWAHGAHSTFNLWEGNYQSGLNWDYYWGTNSHNTAFRNRFTSKDKTINYNSYHQLVAAINTQAYNRYMNIIGNVLGESNWSDTYEETSSPRWQTHAIYGVGQGGAGESGDLLTRSTMLRHMNFDYATNSTKYCDDFNEPGCQGGNTRQNLPNSYYLTSKPVFFGSLPWPVIGPDLSPMAGTLPAKERFDAIISGP